MAQPEQSEQPWEYTLRKYLLLLATLVVNVTYAAGFNPPGGVWQAAYDGQPAGDPIIRDTHYHRYLAFFYCNATAFAASLVVIVLILILAVRHDKEKEKKKKDAVQVIKPLRVVMVLDLLGLVGAYGAGTCRDRISIIYTAVLVAAVFAYIVVLKLLDRCRPNKNPGSSSSGATPISETNNGVSATTTPDLESDRKVAEKALKTEEQLCKVLMLLATFAVSITYVAGLSTPGGFWDSTGGRHHPGDAILRDQRGQRLTAFFLFNTTAFVASLLIAMLLIIDGKKLRDKTARFHVLYVCIFAVLVGLLGAYAAGSCRKTDTTVYVVSLVGAVLAYILLHLFCSPAQQNDGNQQSNDASGREALDKARSLVLLLATLAATITYTAGLDPPGGVWQDNGDGHMAGDPILLATNARRYKAFYYCNSVAFVASLVVIILVQMEKLVKHHVLEAAMILDLFGLIGAYAAGSCRNVNTSIYVMALAGAVLIYVVIHVVFFTLDHRDQNNNDQEDQLLEKKRKRLLLFAILTATITYQAGLTPPGGFLLQDDKLGHHTGDPVLLYNYPRRYHAFFYCNSVSFMLSIALIILLVNPNLYRPAIRSNALSVCTAVGCFCLMGAYAAGSTQHIKTSVYIFVLVAVVLCVAAGLLLVFLLRELNKNGAAPAAPSRPTGQEGGQEENRNGISAADVPSRPTGQGDEEEENRDGISAADALSIPIEQEEEEKAKNEKRKNHARRKYLMLLGILVASVAYQAGLEPPGGTWQNNDNRYKAGNPVMHDNMRPRYLVFFYSNSISFVASIVVIIMLLPHWLPDEREEKWKTWSLKVMNRAIRLDLFALLVAYAAGSNRGWKTSVIVVALIIAVLSYFAIHMILSCTVCQGKKTQGTSASLQHVAMTHKSSNQNPPAQRDSLSV
ncbi:uncharacterized protein LOC119318340 [Triticum dicoccoides]|uniref:uncharacterized protein LOC119318340 n=1 Tax=Triticum dicoccoides TaxID=85692 RepID=UPI001890EC80|nr:uncharacterized protein LOC119318340 [Triticum dicoccoides]